MLNGGNLLEVQIVDTKQMSHLVKKKSQGVMAQICNLHVVSTEEVPTDLNEVLKAFDDVFLSPLNCPQSGPMTIKYPSNLALNLLTSNPIDIHIFKRMK